MTEDENQEQPEPEPEPAVREDWPGAEPKQAAWLSAYVFYCGHKSRASKAAKVSRTTAYRWMQHDPNFQALLEIARKQAFGALEDEMIERAKWGVAKGIYYEGRRVAIERTYSDGLLMMLARAGDPKYRSSEVAHKHEGEVKLKFSGQLADLLALYHRTIQEDAA
jgi:hypothetical protein